MKKLVILFVMVMLGLSVNAQTLKYPFGAATVKSATLDTTALTFSVTNSVEFVNVAQLDTNAVVRVTATNAKAGYLLYMEVKADTVSNRTVTFYSGIKGLALTCTKAKTYVIHAVHNGTQYIVLNTKQED